MLPIAFVCFHNSVAPGLVLNGEHTLPRPDDGTQPASNIASGSASDCRERLPSTIRLDAL